ncbi:MAG: hypothetical protein IIB58_07405 [Planctomycetes bacterium]|nr:hypothetical protein [Planctomycetota bacterium]
MLVVFHKRSSEVAEELRDALKYYERVIGFATDRTEPDCKRGCFRAENTVVHVLAMRGMIELLMERLSSRGSEVDDSLTSHLSSLIQSWNAYVEEFLAETSSKLGEQYESFVLGFYDPDWITLESPYDLSYFDYFLIRRDSVECFLVGSDVEWPEKDFRGPLIEAERKLKDYVKTSVVPNMLKEFPPSAVTEGNIEWLPESFWWRHL